MDEASIDIILSQKGTKMHCADQIAQMCWLICVFFNLHTTKKRFSHKMAQGIIVPLLSKGFSRLVRILLWD